MSWRQTVMMYLPWFTSMLLSLGCTTKRGLVLNSFTGAMTFSMTTLIIMTLNLKGLSATRSIMAIKITRCIIECHYAECSLSFIVMLSVVMLKVVAPVYLLSHHPRSLGYLVQPTTVKVKFFGGILQFEIWYHFLYILPAVTFSKVVTFCMDLTPIQQYNYSEFA